jgi:hypothetical protein
MRKFLTSFLMLVMLMPGLACAMPQCMHHLDKAHMAAGKPCSGHENHESKAQNHPLMLFKDCAKVDMSAACGDVVIKKQDFAGKIYVPAIHAFSTQVFGLAERHAIRGPPPDWPDVSQTIPSILLTTLRFRQ